MPAAGRGRRLPTRSRSAGGWSATGCCSTRIPFPTVDIDGLARVAQAVDLPIAIGEAYPDLFALRPLIERGIIDVAQPDTGRFGGLWQMRKLAAIAEAHQVMVAPHQGSLGPVAEMAAIHLLATLPNYLIHEYLVNDVPQRYEVMTGQPVIEDGHILVPDRPGLGVDLDEEAIRAVPPAGQRHPGRGRSGLRLPVRRGPPAPRRLAGRQSLIGLASQMPVSRGP